MKLLSELRCRGEVVDFLLITNRYKRGKNKDKTLIKLLENEKEAITNLGRATIAVEEHRERVRQVEEFNNLKLDKQFKL